MFLSEKDFTIDRSKNAYNIISRLDTLLGTFIANKRHITKKMTKGYLDYHGLTSDKFSWRFERILNKSGENLNAVDENGMPINRKCDEEVNTAEEFYGMEYESVNICQDKVDEYYNDVASRNFSVGVKSIAYTSIRYIFSNLISKKFDNHRFKQELQKSQFNGGPKGTGFLRVCFEDKEKLFGSLSSSPIKTNTGVKIESVDPEDVFVDVNSQNPQEMFIVSEYEVSELLGKFPILDDKKLIIERFTDNILDEKIPDNANFIKKTWRRPRHVGEKLLEIYNTNDLSDNRFQYLLNGIKAKGNITNEADGKVMFLEGYSSIFYNNYLNSWTDTPDGYRDKKYEVVEYYNLNSGLYVVYIDDIILYLGKEGSKDKGKENKGIPEPFKTLPIVPIYMDNKYTGYFGNPLTEYFSSFQKMITEADHAQRINSLLTGQETVIMDSNQIDEDYHPDKQIQISKNSPLNTIHIKPDLVEGRLQQAITPLMFSNNSSIIHQNRKNDLYNMMERQFPSLKAIIASNSPEAQRDTMYSRDTRINLTLKRQCLSLAELAYKTFISIIYELEYFSPNPRISIPLFKGSTSSSGFTIAKSEKELDTLREKKNQELEKIYEEEINRKINEYKNRPEILSPVIQQVKQEITMQVIQSSAVQQLFPNGMGATPEEQSANITALLQRQEIASAIRNIENTKLEEIVTLRLSDTAKQEVQKIPDNNIYFSIAGLNDYTKLLETVDFSFEKSRLERENDMIRFTNMISPFQQMAGFMFNSKEMAQEIAMASGFNPDLVVVDKQPEPSKIYEKLNTKNMVSQNISLDKNPLLVAQWANDQAGREVYKEEDIVKSMIGLEQLRQKLNIEEISARNTSKAQTNILQTQATEQFKSIQNQQNQENQQQPTNNM